MKHIIAVAIGASLALPNAVAGALQDYPNKPIRFILAYPPGGGTDILARILGNKLSENIIRSEVVNGGR